MFDLIIPSCKPRKDIADLVREIEGTTDGFNLILTGFEASAAINRNYGLHQATNDVVIMADDDMTGFFDGWADLLVESLESADDVKMTAARLMDENGLPGPMMGVDQLLMNRHSVGAPAIPSACIAFYNDGTFFDERYIGSGFEDTDFCFQLRAKHGQGIRFLVDNKCRLIHTHEMKNQDENFNVNHLAFARKWYEK